METNRKKTTIFRKELYENFDVFLEEVIQEQSRKRSPTKELLFAAGAVTGVATILRFIPVSPVGLLGASLPIMGYILKTIFDDLPSDKKEKKIAEIEHYQYQYNQIKLAMKYDNKGTKREMKTLFDEMVKNL